MIYSFNMKHLIFSFACIAFSGGAFAQNTACTAEQLYLNTGCASNTTTFNNFNNTLAGTSTVDPACTADNETTQAVTWVTFTANATSITVTNNTDYAGPGAANIEKKDFVLYSGTCSTLTQVACATEVVGSGGTSTFTGLTVGATYFMMVSRSSASITEGCPSCNNANFCVTSSANQTPPANACNTCTSPCALTTNSTLSGTTLNATADAFICSGSVENNVWYQWCAPATWPAGQDAYIEVDNQFCNSSSGIQLTVWNIGANCPTAATNANLVCQNPGSTTNFYFQWTATASTCYRIVIDGFGGTVCSFDITVGDVTVLPIELVNFNAVPRAGSVKLTWMTATEQNNDYFTIEKTIDGFNYEEVGKVDGNGNTSRIIEYSLIDYKPYDNVSYYRLKQTDFNGKVSYSSLVPVEMEDQLEDLVVYPNPAKGNNVNIYYNAKDEGDVIMKVYDSMGRLIMSRNSTSIQGANTITADLSGMSKGIYFVTLTSGSQVLKTKLIID
jgi:hypothetical protein